MKVLDLMPKLVRNDDFVISIADEDNRNIITFNVAGYIGLSAELNDREVKEILVAENKKTIKVFLTAIDNSSDPVDPDPTDPNDLGNP